MPDIDSNTVHTRNLSDAEKAELRSIVEQDERDAAALEADDAGGEEDEAGGQGAAAGADEGAGAAGKAAKPAKEKEGGGAGEGGAAAGAGEGAAEGGEAAAGAEGAADGVVTPKQVNGVLAELRGTRAELKQTKAELAAIRNAKPEDLPERDFDAEDAAIAAKLEALDKKYDEGDALTDDEYRAQTRVIQNEQRALDRERAKYEVHAHFAAQRAAAEQDLLKDAQEQWNKDIQAWETGLGDWLKNPLRRSAVNRAMELMNQDPEMAQLANADYLQKLDQYLADEFQTFPRREEAAGGGGGAPASDRARAAARAAAAAGSQPPVINGGVGNRGTTPAEVDVEKLPLGSFKKLPKEQRAAAMGVRPEDL